MRKKRHKRKRRLTKKQIRKHWAVFKAEKELDRAFDLAMQRGNT